MNVALSSNRASSLDDVFYITLDYFQSDWLNETWLARSDVQDDYRFVYMGPKGTWYECTSY